MLSLSSCGGDYLLPLDFVEWRRRPPDKLGSYRSYWNDYLGDLHVKKRVSSNPEYDHLVILAVIPMGSLAGPVDVWNSALYILLCG